ncbi:MAG: transcriptional regulator [Clostridia bacterium]|nr:transcriptional regulator [Clostridia bacterium]MBR6649845.1 transcriptional regulator [Clostridia bacterium]
MKKYIKGDFVVYGTNGICKIDDVQKMTFPMETEEHTYYVLKPISNRTSTLFVPDNREELVSKMRYILKREEIDAILCAPQDKEIKWIDDKNERANEFKRILKDGNTDELLYLIRCLYERKKQLTDNGKKLTITDDNVLTSAEKLVREEFAFALNIEEEKVADYIKHKIED